MSTNECSDWNKALLENISESQVEGKALKEFSASSQEVNSKIEWQALNFMSWIKEREGCLLKVGIKSRALYE